MLIYSGDHDFVVPFTGTRAWVYGMNLTVDQPYSPWMFQSQVRTELVHLAPCP